LKIKLVDFAWIGDFPTCPARAPHFSGQPGKKINQPDFFYPERLF